MRVTICRRPPWRIVPHGTGCGVRVSNQYVIPANAGIQNAMHSYYVYILASKRNGTLYIGVTNNLERRVFEHKNKLIKGFTEKYQIEALVYYEWFTNIEEAIKREKQLKKWNRAWKLDLIEKKNPQWIDLSTMGYQFPINETGFPHSRE